MNSNRFCLCLLLLCGLPCVARAEFVDQFFGGLETAGSFVGTALLVVVGAGLTGWLLWHLFKSWRSWYDG